jgi:hypothetical protein
VKRGIELTLHHDIATLTAVGNVLHIEQERADSARGDDADRRRPEGQGPLFGC